jgi:mannosyltransferase OCH1-like enzyme
MRKTTKKKTSRKSIKREYNMKKWISPILKKIHFIWIGTNPLPDYFKLFLKGFRKMNPEFSIRVWGNKDITKNNFPSTYTYINVIKKMHGKPIRDSPSAPTMVNSKGEVLTYSKWAQITDLMRLEIIYRNSGYYFDTTYECLKPLYDLFNRKEKFVGCNESSYPLHKLSYLSNSFFGATKGNPILKRLLTKKSLGAIDLYWWRVNETTGPYYLRSGIRKSDSYHIYPPEYFYPFVEYETQGRKVGTNKCHSVKHKKTNSKSKSKYIKLHKKGYIYYPCDKYPKTYVLKHWELGKTWVKT